MQEHVPTGDAAFGGNVINESKLPKAKKLLCPMHLQIYFRAAIRCNPLQSTTIHCNPLQSTAIHCNVL